MLTDYSPEQIQDRMGSPNHDVSPELTRRIAGMFAGATVLAVIAPDSPQKNAAWPLLAARPLLADKATADVCRQSYATCQSLRRQHCPPNWTNSSLE